MVLPGSFPIDFLSDLPAILLKNFNNHNTPVNLKIGIIDIKVTVVILASLSQYLAPIVFGIISDKIRTKIVIIVETIPINVSSVIFKLKKEYELSP